MLPGRRAAPSQRDCAWCYLTSFDCPGQVPLWPGNLERYEQQQDILGDRNSFSKTDSDATFMRMKEDYMNKGQLKAGYNIQFTTQNQMIVNYTLHQAVTDTTTLAPHMDSFFQLYETMPEVLTADAGYGIAFIVPLDKRWKKWMNTPRPLPMAMNRP